MQELIKALIKAKAEFNPIQKDGTHPHYKHKYATLDAVISNSQFAIRNSQLMILHIHHSLYAGVPVHLSDL